MIMLDVAVTSLATEIKDSPLVDSSTESRVMLGYTSSFLKHSFLMNRILLLEDRTNVWPC